VTEWASRAGLFSRMLARAYPSSNGPPEVLAGRSPPRGISRRARNGLEGEIASHTRRSRRSSDAAARFALKSAARWKSSRKKSRALSATAQAHAEEEEAARGELRGGANARAHESAARANEADRAGKGSRQIYEQSGAALAMVEVKRQQLKQREAKRSAREAIAKGSAAGRSKSLRRAVLLATRRRSKKIWRQAARKGRCPDTRRPEVRRSLHEGDRDARHSS